MKGRHTLEPVMFTLGIFNRSFRNQHRAWRPLGFMPNIDVIAQHAKADDKQQDKAWCLRILLSELVAHQELCGIRWAFTFGQTQVECRLQIPVHTVMGDTVGFEWLMAKVANKGTSGRPGGRLCRQCNVPFDDLGRRDPTGSMRSGWRATRVNEIRRLRNRKDRASTEKLRDLGYKHFHDGMVCVHFSDPVRGLHGCTPPEVLHAFQLGLAERAIELLVGKKKKTKRKAGEARGRPTKKARCEAAEDEADEEGSGGEDETEGGEEEGEEPEEGSAGEGSGEEGETEGEDQEGEVFESGAVPDSRLKVFSATEKTRVDKIAKALHSHLRRQSDRDLPRTDFAKHGTVNGLAKMQGHERTGVLLVLLCVMVMDHWAHWRARGAVGQGQHGSIEKGMGPGLASNVVKTLALMIQMESFMRWERIPRACLRAVDRFIPVFMDQFLRTFDRSGEPKTAGNNTVKNHYPYHLVENVRRGGSPQNSNSSIGESLHVTAVKRTGRRTNMHTSEFEPNTGERCLENVTIDRSADDLLGPVLEEETEEGVTYGGVVATVSAGCWHTSGNKKVEGFPNWPDSLVGGREVFGIIRDLILPQLGGGSSVTVTHSTTRDGFPFRANPRFSNGLEPKQEWALVNQGGGKLVPHQLLCILEVPENPAGRVWLNGSVIDGPGHYALCHCAVDSLRDSGEPLLPCHEGTLAHADQDMIHWIPKGHFDGSKWVRAASGFPPSLLFVPCDAIAGPVTGFPDLMSHSKPATDYFFIRPHSEWAQRFVEAAKQWGK